MNKSAKAYWRIWHLFQEQEYKRFYRTDSAAAPFYGTADIHKLKSHRTVDEPPIWPIISKIDIASYQLAKNLQNALAKHYSTLSTSVYTVKSTNGFIPQMKRQNIPINFKLISFHVTSLLTSLLTFHYTLRLILF